MAFYDLGADTELDVSWLDEILAQQGDEESYIPEIPDFQLDFNAEPQFSFSAPEQPPLLTDQSYVFQPQDEQVDPGTYMPAPSFYEPQAQEPQVNPVTGAITKAAGGLSRWAINNPKDVVGAGIGAGLGVAGLLAKGGTVPKPDLTSLQQYRRALEEQAAKSSRYNDPVYQAAMRNIQGQLDQPGGHDPRLVRQRAQERAAKEAYYQSRGLLKSDIANRDLEDFDAQTTSLLERDAATRGGQLMNQYVSAAGAASPEQTSRTFSQLANLGIQGAQMEQGAATSNAQLQEARRNQLFKSGGDIFGRAISTDPFEEERKRKAGQSGTLAGTYRG